MTSDNKPAAFITVEGGEGVGKTTNIAYIEQCLELRGIEFISTREPGGTEIAEKLRQLLLETYSETFDPTAELLTMFAARAQHLEACIRPALEKGVWVLCDRFTDATYAYQGGGRQLDVSLIAKLENIVHPNLQPDLTLLLDIEPQLGLARARERAALDRFEQESIAFFERVRRSYQQRADEDPQRFELIDASQTLAQVQADIGAALKRLFASG